MATASVPNTFINGQNADANQVNANFSSIVNWLNTNVIQPDLANFSIFPTLPSSSPTNAYHAAHKNYVDLSMPAGAIIQFGGSIAPSGWLLCDGTAYDGANPVYARLWGAIGTNYGGAGINAFQVPDLKGRVPVGFLAGDADFGSLSTKAGSKAGVSAHSHGDGTLSTSGVGDHGHGVSDPTHGHTAWTDEQGNHNHGQTVESTSSTGESHSHGTSGTAGNPDATNTTGTDYTNSAGQHGHSVGVALSGTGISINTAGAHSHDVTGSTAEAGTANGNLQPYAVVNFIIKL